MSDDPNQAAEDAIRSLLRQAYDCEAPTVEETMGRLADRLPPGEWLYLPQHNVRVRRWPDHSVEARPILRDARRLPLIKVVWAWSERCPWPRPDFSDRVAYVAPRP